MIWIVILMIRCIAELAIQLDKSIRQDLIVGSFLRYYQNDNFEPFRENSFFRNVESRAQPQRFAYEACKIFFLCNVANYWLWLPSYLSSITAL
ncbi:Protein of unknown function [Cotesia congregata]|uniref:Uncharacterized protein n=1 Tax=Cotesia congregata TaxID=51543 RepID=A0A8J2MDV3_COTCN|nr:Protein of unknown function [Cotesia congregata]